MEELFKKLVYSAAISGSEQNVRELIKKELEKYVDEVSVDRVGNLIAKRGKGSPKIMIAAHMDELGLIVKHIDKQGFVKFDTIGGWDERILPGIKVRIHGSKCPVVGVIGSKSIHAQEKEEMKQIYKLKDMFIDIGAGSDKNAKKAGIEIGDFITNAGEFNNLIGSVVTGYGFDDRVGCLELIEVAKRLKSFKGTVYFVGTIQEEIGLIGVRGSAFGIDPDVLIALDVTLTGDTPDMKPGEVTSQLGKGPVLGIKDAISFVTPKVKKWVAETAKKNNMPLQYLVLNGGADDASVGPVIRDGIPSGSISTPTRYLHTPIEVLDMKDVESVIKLTLKCIESAHSYF